MDLKVTPRVNARYWVAILIASMCGTNFGDFFPVTLHISEGPAFLILIGLFALAVAAERLSRRGSKCCPENHDGRSPPNRDAR